MSHFYGTLQGSRGEATRCGTPDSGIVTEAASWSGAVKCAVFVHEEDGEDWVQVNMIPWHGSGTHKVLYRGPIGEYKPENMNGHRILLEALLSAYKNGNPIDDLMRKVAESLGEYLPEEVAR